MTTENHETGGQESTLGPVDEGNNGQEGLTTQGVRPSEGFKQFNQIDNQVPDGGEATNIEN
jgi:hypothetical protein